MEEDTNIRSLQETGDRLRKQKLLVVEVWDAINVDPPLYMYGYFLTLIRN